MIPPKAPCVKRKRPEANGFTGVNQVYPGEMGSDCANKMGAGANMEWGDAVVSFRTERGEAVIGTAWPLAR